MQTLEQIFKNLVKIDSISGEEQELSQYVHNFLREIGVQAVVDKQGMIYARIGPTPKKLFCAHLDTVEPGRNIQIVKSNEYFRSNGNTILGGDNKVSLAAILFSVQELLQENSEINSELLFTVREETNSGIKEFDSKKIRSKVGFVFDGGNGELGWICTQATFLDDFEINITGVSAHASRPEQSKNVLEAIVRLIKECPPGRIDKNSTLNFGIVTAGDASNTIPGSCHIKGDVRSLDPTVFSQLKTLLKSTCKSLKSSGYEVSLEFFPYSTGYTLHENENFKKLKKLYALNDIELIKASTTGGSDASYLNNIGIETYCLGDGVENIHTTNEQVSIAKMKKLSELIKQLILEY